MSRADSAIRATEACDCESRLVTGWWWPGVWASCHAFPGQAVLRCPGGRRARQSWQSPCRSGREMARCGAVIDVSSPVIQVVTSGVDLPAVVAAISGGVVGLAGIIFGARQARRTIGAEDERAVLADKRQIYSKYHASLDDVFTIANILRTEHGPDRPKYLSELQSSSVVMFNGTSDVMLTAPQVSLAGRGQSPRR